MFDPSKLSHLLEDRVTVGKGLEEPPLRGLKEEAAPFTLQSLVAWLEKQNPEATYRFECLDGSCLIGRYATAHGFGHLSYSAQVLRIVATGQIENAYVTHIERVAVMLPHTFGAALQRALVLQANAVSGSSPSLISEGV